MRKVINKKTEFIKDQCKKFVIMIFVTITLQQCFDGIAKALQSSIQPDIIMPFVLPPGDQCSTAMDTVFRHRQERKSVCDKKQFLKIGSLVKIKLLVLIFFLSSFSDHAGIVAENSFIAFDTFDISSSFGHSILGAVGGRFLIMKSQKQTIEISACVIEFPIIHDPSTIFSRASRASLVCSYIRSTQGR